MTTPVETTFARTLRERLEAPLGGHIELRSLARLPGGTYPDNLRVEVEIAGGPRAGRRVYVLRCDPGMPHPRSLRRAQEYAVVGSAVRSGVRTPTPVVLLLALLAPGVDAYLTDFAPGVAFGARVVREPALEVARARLPLQLAESLASLHTLTPAREPALPIARPPFLANVDPVEAQLTLLAGQVDAQPRPRPPCEYTLGWLRHHPPVSRELTLVHGDFRTGNFLVTEQGLSAVVAWEAAHWGSPLEDLAALTQRDARFGWLDKPVGGFGDLETFLAAYVDLSGRPIRPADLHWWSVAANLRAAVCGPTEARRPADEIERFASRRRTREFEFEALRLIEVGP